MKLALVIFAIVDSVVVVAFIAYAIRKHRNDVAQVEKTHAALSPHSKRRRYDVKVKCPRCDGDGEEPGAPIEDDGSVALCALCGGKSFVPARTREEYLAEQSDE